MSKNNVNNVNDKMIKKIFDGKVAMIDPDDLVAFNIFDLFQEKEDKIVSHEDVKIVNIRGVLLNTGWGTTYGEVLGNITSAIEEGFTKILLRIGSPGGGVAGVFDTAEAIYNLRNDIEIVSVVDDQATSAAYLIASATSRVYISETSRVGSIGAAIIHTSIEKSLEKEGRDVTIISSGKNKVEGSPYKQLSDEAKQHRQQEVDEIRQLFVERVGKYRNLPTKELLDTEAKVFDGHYAIDNKLADEIINVKELFAKEGMIIDLFSEKGGTGMNKEDVGKALKEMSIDDVALVMESMGYISAERAKADSVKAVADININMDSEVKNKVAGYKLGHASHVKSVMEACAVAGMDMTDCAKYIDMSHKEAMTAILSDAESMNKGDISTSFIDGDKEGFLVADAVKRYGKQGK
jgi:signal peptide peptidase SppA